LQVTPASSLRLDREERRVRLGGGETRDFQFPITAADPVPANNYPIAVEFESTAGTARWTETVHDLVVRRRTILVDGKLSDWSAVPPVLLYGFEPSPRDLSRSFDELRRERTNACFAEYRMAWDDRHLYVGARVQDPSPGRPKQRLETWDEDQYFRSARDDEVCEQLRPFEWLLMRSSEGTPDRAESARIAAEWARLQQVMATNTEARAAVASGAAQVYFRARQRNPSASFAAAGHVYRKLPWDERPHVGDTLQIGLDPLPGYAHHRVDPGLVRLADGFHAVPDTDYEFCAYLCEDGEPEVWRLLAPGVPRSHPAPRRLKSKVDQGPVPEAECVVLRVGTLLTYELAIPWSARSEWPPRAGARFGCLFRINNDVGPPLTFGEGKSATRANGLSLHPYHEASPNCGVGWVLGS
jgi:hypothetical protein